MDQTNVEREDRTMNADSLGDGMAGSEGIDEPSMHEHNRMSTRGGRQQGREGSTDDASSFGGQGNQRENSSDRAEGTGYTGNSSRSSRSGRSNRGGHRNTSRTSTGDRTSRESGDGSTTEQSDSENPLT